jgi:hypothetical protein
MSDGKPVPPPVERFGERSSVPLHAVTRSVAAPLIRNDLGEILMCTLQLVATD